MSASVLTPEVPPGYACRGYWLPSLHRSRACSRRWAARKIGHEPYTELEALTRSVAVHTRTTSRLVSRKSFSLAFWVLRCISRNSTPRRSCTDSSTMVMMYVQCGRLGCHANPVFHRYICRETTSKHAEVHPGMWPTMAPSFAATLSPVSIERFRQAQHCGNFATGAQFVFGLSAGATARHTCWTATRMQAPAKPGYSRFFGCMPVARKT